MKPVLALILAIALGIATGYAYFSLESANTPEPFYDGEWSKTTSKGDDFAATLAMSAEFYDFGEMKSNKTYITNFDIKNAGKADLTFSFAGEPPSNVSINYEPGKTTRLKPGSSAPLKVTVTPEKSGEDFQRVLVIGGNDPNNMPKQITLVGRVNGGIEADQRIVSMSRKELKDNNVVTLNLYSFEHDSIDISETEFKMPELGKWVSIESFPLTQEELKVREGAKSGCRVVATINPEVPRNVRQIRMKFPTTAEGYSPIGFLIFVAN